LEKVGMVAAPEMPGEGRSPGISLSPKEADKVRRLIEHQKRESSPTASASSAEGSAALTSLEPEHAQLPGALSKAAAAATAEAAEASAPSAEEAAAPTTTPIEGQLQASPSATYSKPDATAVSMSPAHLCTPDSMTPPMHRLCRALVASNEERQRSLDAIDKSVSVNLAAGAAEEAATTSKAEAEAAAAAAAAAAASAEKASPAPATDQPGDQPDDKTAFSLLENQELEDLARCAYNIPGMQGDEESDGAINMWTPPTGFGEPKYVTQSQLRYLTLAAEVYKKEIDKMVELRQRKFEEDPPTSSKLVPQLA
jgi:hypothetical protein